MNPDLTSRLGFGLFLHTHAPRSERHGIIRGEKCFDDVMEELNEEGFPAKYRGVSIGDDEAVHTAYVLEDDYVVLGQQRNAMRNSLYESFTPTRVSRQGRAGTDWRAELDVERAPDSQLFQVRSVHTRYFESPETLVQRLGLGSEYVVPY